MGFFEDSIIKAREVIDIAGKKTSEVISLQKFKLDASALQSQIAKDYELLGRLYYESLKDTLQKDEKAISVLISEMDTKIDKLAEMERQIAMAKGVRVCPACTASNPDFAAYCSSCGQKLIFDSGEEQPPNPTAAEDAQSAPENDTEEESNPTEE